MRTLWLCVCLALMVAGCKKDKSKTAASVVTPADAVPTAFLDFLPDDTAGFGYVHLDQPWLKAMEPHLVATHRAMVADFQAMAKRRFGADLAGLTSIGFAVIGERPIVFLGGIAGALKATGDAKPSSRNGATIVDLGDVAVAQTGSLWMVGEMRLIDKVLAAKGSAKRLLLTQSSWTKLALAEAGNSPALITVRRDQLAKLGSPVDQGEMSDVDLAALVVKSTGLHLAMVPKPGRAAVVETALRNALTQARAHVDRMIAQKADGTAGAELLAVFARHYGYAWLDGVSLRSEADRVVVDLPWRKPSWDRPFAPAPSWSDRAVAADEFFAAQINFGGPALEHFLAWSDVLGRPLDRAAARQDLTGVFANHIGMPYRDFAAIGVSGGKNALFVSFVAPPTTPAPPPGPVALTPVVGKEVAVGIAPWGTAVARAKERGALQAALAKAPSSLPLLSLSKLAGGDGKGVFMRAAVDFTRLPPEVASITSQVPLVHLDFRAGEAGFEAEVVTQPGKSDGVVGMVNMVKGALKGQSEAPYKKRESLSVGEELVAIFQYHQAAAFDRIVVTDMGNDRLRMSISSAEMGQDYMKYVAPVAVIGVAAAVAIPAFMKYATALGPSQQIAK